MRFIISGKNIEVTKALRAKIEDKLSKFDKFFVEDTEVHVTLSVEKSRHIMEVTIPLKGSLIRVEVAKDDMYQVIDDVVDKVERQLKKYKNKLHNYKRTRMAFKNNFFEVSSEESEVDNDQDDMKIVRSKKFALKPMDPKEACLEMELLGHNFFVFRNGDSGEVNVVYKRKKEGTYGLIEPEF